jgi:hypothetical protein
MRLPMPISPRNFSRGLRPAAALLAGLSLLLAGCAAPTQPAQQANASPTQAPAVQSSATPVPAATPAASAAPTIGAPLSSVTPAAPARPTASTASAIASPAAPAGSPAPKRVATLPPNVPDNQKAVWSLWINGPHSSTYGLDKGPNTYCARCHSPENYDPKSTVDAPPNCVSCKFPTDQLVRKATGNPLVVEADWKSIGCLNCHRVEKDVVSSELAWRDPATGQYLPVGSTTALCEKCHTDTDTLRHHRDMGTTAHKDLGCTSCHNPHSAQANCSASGCHTGITGLQTASATLTPLVAEGSPEPAKTPATSAKGATTGHDAAHSRVTCSACHDASGLTVGKIKETGIWSNWRVTEVAGRKTNAPYVSHNLQRQVDCGRCHFAGNGFGLSVQATTKQ